MIREKKLFNLLSEDCVLPWHVDFEGKVVTRAADNIPFIYWPNRTPCFEANIYMLSLFDKGRSRNNRGGTLAEYAKKISHLIRFCFKNEIKFTELNDNFFVLFIRGLQVKNSQGLLQRSCNEVIKIIQITIDFLRVVAKYYDNETLIGEQGCSVTISEREHTIHRGKGKKSKTVKYWSHEDSPDPDPVKKRHPIGVDVVKALKKAAGKIEDKGLRKRTELMLACFEQSGGRRGEVSIFQVKDIKAASRSKGSAPLLRIDTLKGGNERFVPVPRTFIQQAMKYIQRVRRRIIRDKLGTANDHGFLLISHTTGNKLAIDTLTTQVHKLCVAAGVNDKPGHPHLFRHAFITQKFISAILLYDIKNEDEFRKALLDTSSIKQEIMEWTGHLNESTLDIYIDLAFAEITNMKQIYNAISLRDSVGVVLDRVDSLKAEIAAKQITTPELFEEFDDLLEAFKIDISAAITESEEESVKTKS